MGSGKSGADAMMCNNGGAENPFAAMLIVFILPDETWVPVYADARVRAGLYFSLS